jgi:hypothetical protein
LSASIIAIRANIVGPSRSGGYQQQRHRRDLPFRCIVFGFRKLREYRHP